MTYTAHTRSHLCDWESLDERDCMHLLASGEIGHLGVTAKALPVVTPVRYRVVGREIVFATRSELELQCARNNVVACMEVSGVDNAKDTDWTVLATGRLRVADDASRSWPGPLPAAWGAAEPSHVLTLSIELLGGSAFPHVGAH